MKSSILNTREIIELNNLCEFSNDAKWTCLYQSQDNKIDKEELNEKRLNVPNILYLIETTNNHILGAFFSSVIKNCRGGFIKDEGSFIFSFKNLRGTEFKSKTKEPSNSIYHSGDYVISLGKPDDLSVYSYDNLTCKSEFPGTYEDCGFTKEDNILLGSAGCEVKRLEVFKIENIDSVQLK